MLKRICDVGDRQLNALGHTTETQKVHAIVGPLLRIRRGINLRHDTDANMKRVGNAKS